MAEGLVLPKIAQRREVYAALKPQIEALLDGEPDLIATRPPKQ